MKTYIHHSTLAQVDPGELLESRYRHEAETLVGLRAQLEEASRGTTSFLSPQQAATKRKKFFRLKRAIAVHSRRLEETRKRIARRKYRLAA